MEIQASNSTEPPTIQRGLQHNIFVSIGVLGMILNSMVLIVLFTNKGILGSHPRKIIYHQSWIDLLAAICLVISQFHGFYLGSYIYPDIPHPDWYCTLQWSTYMLWSMMQCSTWNLELLTVERYISICHPLFHRHYCTQLILFIFFIFVWIGGFVCMSFLAFNFKYFPVTNECMYVLMDPVWLEKLVGTLWAMWSYFLPVGTILFCYRRIYVVLKSRVQPTGDDLGNVETLDIPGQTDTAGNKKEKDAAKKLRQQQNFVTTCMIIGAAYVVCYTTNTITWWQYTLGGPLDPQGIWYPFTVAMTFSNCLVNPIIYSLRMEQFQRGLRRTFCHGVTAYNVGGDSTIARSVSMTRGSTNAATKQTARSNPIVVAQIPVQT